MDKIWERNPSWSLWRGWKNEWQRRTDKKFNTKKKANTKFTTPVINIYIQSKTKLVSLK